MGLDTNYKVTMRNKKLLENYVTPQLNKTIDIVNTLDNNIKTLNDDINQIDNDIITINSKIDNIVSLKKSETGIYESRLQITSSSGTQTITTILQTNIDNVMIVTLKGVCFTADQRDVTQTLFVNNFNRVYLSSGGTGTNFYITNLKQHSSGYLYFELAWADFPTNALAGLHILGCDVYGI